MTEFLVRLLIKDYEKVQQPDIRQKYGILGGMVGLLCNLLLFAAKLIAGMLTSSISVMADAFNNLSDAGSSVVTLVGFKIAGAPADNQHPFGHGRIEYIAGLIVSLIIMLMGFELGKTSAEKIFFPEAPSFSLISLLILIGSILLKLWMCLFNRKLGEMIQSTAMKATAMDSLSDVVATSAVVVGIFISKFTHFEIDGYIGVLVALFIFYTGFTTARDTLNPLLGQAPDPQFVKQIEQEVLSYDGIIGLHDLMIHNYGPGRSIISLHAEVPASMDLLEIHNTIDRIERDLKQKFSCEVVIHMDPVVTDDELSNQTQQAVSNLVKLIDPRICIHDFRMVGATDHTNLIFDVVVPYKFRLNDDEIRENIDRAVKILDESYTAVVNIDKAYIHP